jgi:transcription initiation factor TFIIH subunit 3
VSTQHSTFDKPLTTAKQAANATSKRLMDHSSSHLSLIIDLSPSQWHLSAQSTHPLSFQTFLSHVLTFLNSHIAAKHENTLAVFGALPGKRSVLSYSVVGATVTDL